MIEVPVVNFSSCLQKYGIPHYLKIDIEGMDIVCLRALKCFEQKPDYVSIESEKVLFDNLIEELNLLTELGYTRFKAIQQGVISRQREPNPSTEGRYVGASCKIIWNASHNPSRIEAMYLESIRRFSRQ